MQIRIDRKSKEPLYRQIANCIENSILQGKLFPGMQLPTERKLAKQLGVNRSTVTAAYEELRSTGLIQSKKGSGTRVSDSHWGVSLRRLPNWYEYTNGGSFFPSLPLVRRIRDAASDEQTINLSLGELSPDLLPSEKVAAISGQLPFGSALSYPDPKGNGQLRETLSVHLSNQYGIRVSPEQILITSGGHQALHLITQCLLSPGDAVAIEGPSYAYSLPLFVSAGLRLFRIPLDDKGLLPEEVENLHRKNRIRMIFVNPTYQNPTGTSLTLSRRKQLLDICEKLRIPIVEDDAYRSLQLKGSPPPPPTLFALNREKGLVLFVNSLTKTAAPGFRIGWIVGPELVLQRLSDSKQQMDYGPSTILQKLAENYLSSGMWESHLRSIQSALSSRRDTMTAALSKYVGSKAKWNCPDGGYHIWCQIPDLANEEEFVELGIQQGVLFLPGSVLGAEKGFVRLTYSRCDERQIEEGIPGSGKCWSPNAYPLVSSIPKVRDFLRPLPKR